MLLVEDDERQQESLRKLLGAEGVELTVAGTVKGALAELEARGFDCMVLDPVLPDGSGYDLLEKMAAGTRYSFPPVIVYTGREIERADEERLHAYSRSIIVKGARSPERLLDEVTLFLHRVESDLPLDQRRMLADARQRETAFEGRTHPRRRGRRSQHLRALRACSSRGARRSKSRATAEKRSTFSAAATWISY